jgi:cyclophilin family peptidyl-prolyl cis-trans isomerase
MTGSLRSVVLLAILTSTLLGGCGRIPPEIATTAAPTATNSAPASTSTPDADAASCEYVTTGQASKPVDPPPSSGVPASGTVSYVMKLDSGDVKITMDRSKAPCTVNSFVSLADQGFFDKTSCHGLSDTGTFVLQCGDPTGTGQGGPGYQFANETDGTESYLRGVVAMANSDRDTNGSQFFLFWADSSGLDAKHQYTIFGEMDPDSTDVVAAIGGQGRDEDDRPIARADIISVKPE